MHLKLEKNKFREIYPFKPFLSHVTNMLHLFVYHYVPVGRTWDEDYNLICIWHMCLSCVCVIFPNSSILHIKK